MQPSLSLCRSLVGRQLNKQDNDVRNQQDATDSFY